MSSDSPENDDVCASMTRPSESGGLSSSSSARKSKSESGTVFQAWRIQLMVTVKVDLCQGTTAVERRSFSENTLVPAQDIPGRSVSSAGLS